MPHSAGSALSIRFGEFELDVEAGELRRNGARLKIEGQPLQILQLLLEKSGRVVTREELRRRLWPADTYVDFEHGINSAVKRLRQALDDSSDTPRFIETLPRRGYRFIGPLDHGSARAGRAAAARRSGWVAVAAAVFLASTVWVAVVRPGVWSAGRAPAITSLAALPVENRSGDAGQDYLAEGIHDDLVASLSQISALTVTARRSVLRYGGAKQAPGAIARELRVDAVLETTLRRDNDRWHVTARLVSARDEAHLWADSYDRDMGHLATLPSEIAVALANSLHIALKTEEKSRLAKAHPLDPALLDAFFKGKYYADKMTRDGGEKAIAYYHAALDIDPGFAPGWANLGSVYLNNPDLYSGERVPEGERRKLAEAALTRAAGLDPGLAGPHLALGRLRFMQWDWISGAREFELAHDLDPAITGFAIYHLTTGRFDQAVEGERRHAERFPLDYSAQLILGWTAFMAGRFDDAMAALKAAVRLDPNINHARRELAWTYVKKGMYREAIAECEIAFSSVLRETGRALVPGGCEWVYAEAGRRREALELAAKVESETQAPHRFLRLAHVHDALGDRERALESLRRAYEGRPEGLPREWSNPMLSDGIKADPRFQELIKRTGNPWAKFPPAQAPAAVFRKPGEPGQ